MLQALLDVEHCNIRLNEQVQGRGGKRREGKKDEGRKRRESSKQSLGSTESRVSLGQASARGDHDSLNVGTLFFIRSAYTRSITRQLAVYRRTP